MNWNQLYVNYQQHRREKRRGGRYREIAEFVGKKSVLCVQYSMGRVFVGGNNKLVRVWDLSLAQQQQQQQQQQQHSKAKGLQLSGHSGSVTCMQVNESRVITGSSDKTMRLWNLNSNKQTATFMGHSKTVSSLKATQRCLASGAANGTVRLWDIEATVPVSTYKEHSRSITALAFLGEDRLLLSSSADGTIRVWDTRASDKRAVRVMSEHQGKVLGLDVDLHLGRIVSGGADGTVRVWSLSNGKCERLDHISNDLAAAAAAAAAAATGATTTTTTSSTPVAVTQIQAQNQLALCGLADGRIVWWDPYGGTSLQQAPHATTTTTGSSGDAGAIRAMHEAANVLVYGSDKIVKVLSFTA